MTEYYIRVMVIFSFSAFVPYFSHTYLLNKLNLAIVKNVRKAVYAKLLRMPVSWIEQRESSRDGLAADIGRDSQKVASLLTNFVPVVLMNSLICLNCLIVCVYHNWILAAIAVCYLPVSLAAMGVVMVFVGGYNDASLSFYDGSNKVAH